jgi:DNA-binding transcriptional LysR family regulator
MRPKLLRAHLNELFVFDVAARTGSFSKAARELGMTQSAVSHHVANLEVLLGTQLFDRVWRGVALTDTGRELHQASGRAFPALADGLEAATSKRNARQITIHTDFAVAAYYLMPRLSHLRQAANGADIRILTMQAPSDLDLNRLDCGIVFGSTTSFGAKAAPLMHEVVVPVASPAVASDLGQLSAATLPRSRLLQLETETGDWLDWQGYAALANLPRPDDERGLIFNNYQLLIEAALSGDGVALGWRPLVDRFLETGRLAAVGPTVVRQRWGYFLLQPAPLPLDTGFANLLETIRADFAQAWQGQ